MAEQHQTSLSINLPKLLQAVAYVMAGMFLINIEKLYADASVIPSKINMTGDGVGITFIVLGFILVGSTILKRFESWSARIHETFWLSLWAVTLVILIKTLVEVMDSVPLTVVIATFFILVIISYLLNCIRVLRTKVKEISNRTIALIWFMKRAALIFATFSLFILVLDVKDIGDPKAYLSVSIATLIIALVNEKRGGAIV